MPEKLPRVLRNRCEYSPESFMTGCPGRGSAGEKSCTML